MIEGSSKILMSRKGLEYSICLGSISLAAVDSLLNGLKGGSHLGWKYSIMPYTFSQTRKNIYSEQLRKSYSKPKKKYNGCFKEYIKLSCSFYFLNDIEYDRAGLVLSKNIVLVCIEEHSWKKIFHQTFMSCKST